MRIAPLPFYAMLTIFKNGTETLKDRLLNIDQ